MQHLNVDYMLIVILEFICILCRNLSSLKSSMHATTCSQIPYAPNLRVSSLSPHHYSKLNKTTLPYPNPTTHPSPPSYPSALFSLLVHRPHSPTPQPLSWATNKLYPTPTLVFLSPFPLPSLSNPTTQTDTRRPTQYRVPWSYANRMYSLQLCHQCCI
jgi:hypothetical protein